jgi:hypothetical protein
VLDLSVARSIAAFDKRGGAILSAHVREIVMPGVRRLTRKVAEGFFDDDANFVL